MASTPKPRSAGIVPIRWDGDRWLVLVLRAFRYWDFPKGRYEEPETALQAAIRETKEEADLSDLTFPWGEDSVDTEPYNGGKVATYFVAQTQRADVVLPVSPELGYPEHHEGRWLEFDAAAELLGARVRRVLEWARSRVTSGL
jgi:8-oxo-dGTP pyrophosphatase MutT (NUDIX family)